MNKLLSYYFCTRNSCPICNSVDLVQIHMTDYDDENIKSYLQFVYSKVGGIETEYLKGAKYILKQCMNCDLFFQTEIPDDDLMYRLYEIWIDPEITFDNHAREDGLDYHCMNAKEIACMIAYFNKPCMELDFCDYGMGWGKWALMAKAYGVKVTGVELSEERIKNAKANNINVIDDKELHEHRFDIINTEQVFEHLPDPVETLNKLKYSLKPGGLIKISVPNVRNINKRIQEINWKCTQHNISKIMPVAPLEHINCFSRKSLLILADRCGMHEVKMPIRLQYQYTNNWRGIRNSMINLILPLYRNLLEKQNYLFLEKNH